MWGSLPRGTDLGSTYPPPGSGPPRPGGPPGQAGGGGGGYHHGAHHHHGPPPGSGPPPSHGPPPHGPPPQQNGSGPPPHGPPLSNHSHSYPPPHSHSYPPPHGQHGPPPAATTSGAQPLQQPPPRHHYPPPHAASHYASPPPPNSTATAAHAHAHGQPHQQQQQQQQQPLQQPPPSSHSTAAAAAAHSHSRQRSSRSRYSPQQPPPQSPPIEHKHQPPPRRNSRHRGGGGGGRSPRRSRSPSHRSRSPYGGSRRRGRTRSRSHSPPRRKRRRRSSPDVGAAAYDDLKRQNEELSQQVVDLKRALGEQKALAERGAAERDAKLRHKYEKNKDKLKKNSVLLYKFRFQYPEAEERWNQEESKTEKKFWSLYTGSDVQAFWHEAVRHLYDATDTSARTLCKRDMDFLSEYLIECMSNRMYKNRVDKFHHFWKLFTNFEMLVTGIRHEWLRRIPGTSGSGSSSPPRVSVVGFMSRNHARKCLRADTVPLNACLIRFSCEDVGRYTISFKTRPDHVDHADIVLEGRTLVTYLLDKPALRFKSLRELFTSDFWRLRLKYFFQPEDGRVVKVKDVFAEDDKGKDDKEPLPKDDDVNMTEDDSSNGGANGGGGGYSPTRSPAPAAADEKGDAGVISRTDSDTKGADENTPLHQADGDPAGDNSASPHIDHDEEVPESEYLARARALLDDDDDDDMPTPQADGGGRDGGGRHSTHGADAVAKKDSNGGDSEDDDEADNNASPQYEPSPSSPSYSPMAD